MRIWIDLFFSLASRNGGAQVPAEQKNMIIAPVILSVYWIEAATKTLLLSVFQ